NYDSRTINGHEVVSDSSTNLLWQKGSKSVKNWKEALAYCQNLEYAGYSDWRLPNKNELITIVDYSKADPASSFPGMTSDLLISSTFTVVYGGAEHAIAVHMDSGMVDEYYDSMSVRCVRSDFQPLPAEQPLPYCDESRIGPCEDAATGYVWSSPDIDYGYNNSANPQNYQSVPVTWQKKAIQCRESNEGGISKWRIPTVDEIRTLFPSDEILKTNGECHVTNACFDYLSEDCFNDVCAPGNTPSEVGREKVMSSLFDSGVYFSGTFTDADSHDTVWFVDMRKDSVKRSEEYYDGYGASQSRCIRDDSLPNPVVFPYTDSENGLVWSSLSKKRLQYWYEVAKYCTELVEGGSNNWRVPSMEELWTLVKNCPDGDCVSNTTGEYSVLGDLSNLWSSEISSGDSDNVHLFKFMTASEDSQPIYSENFAKVRCVRSLSDSENVLEFDEESDFPHRLPDLVWSKVSDEEYYNSEDAVAYCNELNEEGYGGETQWTLPTSSELASIINKRVCSNKNDFLTGTTSGRCSQYSFGGYSYFGDMFSLKAEGDYVFDFVQGKMDSYGYGRVRCVVVPPDDAF
ncbi:DUF1566 domain-containing protein, partial [bacterium]|nr:DUF1566 domain-containing protein [bacterium]